MHKFAGLLLAGALALAVACSPGIDVEDISGASDDELDRACEALEEAGYDIQEIDAARAGGRIVEVAATIHALNTGPEQTREYCEDR